MTTCHPVVLFVVGLFAVQLLIFKVGLSYVGDAENEETDGHTSRNLERFQQNYEGQSFGKKQTTNADTSADGRFNGYPVHLRKVSNPRTLSHCVGEDYQVGKSWKQKSCKFEFFCFDTSIKEFVVYQAPSEREIYDLLVSKPFVDVSQSYLLPGPNRTNTMSLGGINLKWGDKKDGVGRLEWFPEIRTLSPGDILEYYELPSNVVMIPFHSMNGGNPGHLVWDDFLPIFTLLSMFQLQAESDLLMMRYVLKDGRGLWASCDFKDEKRELCKKMHKKFLPLMVGLDPIHDITTTEDFTFQMNKEPQSQLVCARNGVAGFGPLTDHGAKKYHGWEDGDYQVTHNHGRGGMLYEFRNFMLSNIGVPTTFEHVPPFRIVFSEKSSENLSRNLDFKRHQEILRQSFNQQYVSIERYVFKDIPMAEQVEIAGQTTIYISGVGGGAVTATFLPRGASVFLYFMATAGIEGGRASGKPAKLDWDLFNNIGYLKVHWLPAESMHKEPDLASFVLLVQHELDAHMRERTYDALFY